MASINVDLNWPDSPKAKRMIDLLGRGAEWLPVALWIYVGRFHAEDGRLIGYSPQAIESACGWRGKPGKCIEALMTGIDVPGLRPLLEACEGGYQVHDWPEHAGHIHAFKVKGQKMARKRWGQDAASMLPASTQHAQGNAKAGQGMARQGKASGAGEPADAVMVALGSQLMRVLTEAANGNAAAKQATRERVSELVAELGSVDAVVADLLRFKAPATPYLSTLLYRRDKAAEDAKKGEKTEDSRAGRTVLNGDESIDEVLGVVKR